MEGPPFPSNFMVGADVCSANPLQGIKRWNLLSHFSIIVNVESWREKKKR